MKRGGCFPRSKAVGEGGRWMKSKLAGAKKEAIGGMMNGACMWSHKGSDVAGGEILKSEAASRSREVGNLRSACGRKHFNSGVARGMRHEGSCRKMQLVNKQRGPGAWVEIIRKAWEVEKHVSSKKARRQQEEEFGKEGNLSLKIFQLRLSGRGTAMEVKFVWWQHH